MNTRTIVLAASLLISACPALLAQFNSCDNLINPIYTDAQIIKPGKSGNAVMQYNKTGKEILDVSYITDSLNNKSCSSSDNCSDGGDQLQYEVYYPDISYSDKNHLPAIIFFHAGGFSDCSNFGHDGGLVTYCTEFAKRGFVAFNVEYRRGRKKDPDSKYTSASLELAIYRAAQDARGAVRTIVARELNHETPYRIDVNNLFLAGQSSGGDIALNVGFCTPKMIKQLFPGVASYLGKIDGDNYAGNAALTSFTIRGVLSMWGGFAIPVNYASSPADFLSQNSKLPALVAFHGGADDEVNINSKNIFFSPSTSSYGKESFCLKSGTYIPDLNGSAADQLLLGSQGLYDNLKTTLHKHCELYIDCDMGHGLDENTSDFGLDGGDAGAVTNDQVRLYIVERAATFFQYMMNKDRPHLKHPRFVDCENDRYGCNTDANSGCDKNAVCPAVAATNLAAVSRGNAVTAITPLCGVKQTNRTVYIHFFQTGNTVITIYDINGTPIKTLKTNSSEEVIDGNFLTPGVYLFRMLRGTQIQNAKIIIP